MFFVGLVVCDDWLLSKLQRLDFKKYPLVFTHEQVY